MMMIGGSLVRGGAASVLLLVLLVVAYPAEASSCLPAPYLYATFHGGTGSSDVNVVRKYSRDGCFLGEPLGEVAANATERELRGMAVLGDGSLLVASAYKGASSVLQFGACAADGTRPYVTEAAANLAAMVHPYAVVPVPSSGDVLVTAQDTDAVVSLTTGRAVFQLPGASDEGVRGMALCFGRLFVADTGSGGVYVLDAVQFHQLGWVTAGGPGTGLAGVLCDEEHAQVLVSVRNSQLPALGEQVVGVLNVTTLKWQDSYALPDKMSHPAGLALDTDTRQLYVAAHNYRNLYRLDLASGEGDYVVSGKKNALPDEPELLLLSSC